MRKAEALLTIIKDERATRRRSRASYERVTKALRTLELSESESAQVLIFMEYHDGSGVLFPCFAPNPGGNAK